MAFQRFLQTQFWASFKEAHGWKALYFIINADSSVSKTESFPAAVNAENALTVLVRSFSLKVTRLSIAYIPMAPEKSQEETNAQYKERVFDISNKIKEYLPPNTICIRYDFPVDFTEFSERDMFTKEVLQKSSSASHLLHCKVAIQPPDTVLLGLDKTEDELLAEMRNKWRYNIRLAQKKGVTINAYHFGDNDFENQFDNFYTLFEQTSKRDGVNFHAKSYYKDLLERGADDNNKEKPLVTLYIARHEEDYLAGIITLFCKKEAVYLYGASGNIKRNFMPAYLLQWTAIQDAKKYGCPVYDFYGMPPTDDPNHPMHGLYLFKTGFGGSIIHRAGSFDMVLKPFAYNLYITAEKSRAFFYKKIVKKFHGR